MVPDMRVAGFQICDNLAIVSSSYNEVQRQRASCEGADDWGVGRPVA